MQRLLHFQERYLANFAMPNLPSRPFSIYLPLEMEIRIQGASSLFGCFSKQKNVSLADVSMKLSITKKNSLRVSCVLSMGMLDKSIQ